MRLTPVALLVAFAVVATSCGSTNSGVKAKRADGVATSDAEANTDPSPSSDSNAGATAPSTATPDQTSIDQAAVRADIARIIALPVDQQEAEARTLDAAYERQWLTLAGVDDALGGAANTDAAFAAVITGINGPIAAWKANPPPLSVGPTHRVGSDEGPTYGALLFAGYLLGAVLVGVGVSATNNGEKKSGSVPDDGKDPKGKAAVKIEGDRAAVSVETEGEYTDKGLKGKFKTKTDLVVCPDVNGKVTGKVHLDLSSTAVGSNSGTNGTFDVEFTAYVNDEAEVADTDYDVRYQMAQFENSKGGFIDLSLSIPGTTKGGEATATLNRFGGVVTNQLSKSTAGLAAIFGLLLGSSAVNAARDGWKSGRCVKLDATTDPAGRDNLKPLTSVAIHATPRSLLDGSNVGGNVYATLVGASDVQPGGTPVPADADFTYTAPAEEDATGGVALEARSKRGIGKLTLSFSTEAPHSYQIVGGLQDWQVDDHVCDVTQGFEITTEIGTMVFSGGLTGTYTFTGVFNSSYSGEYRIDLPDGPGKPGTMTGGGSGVIHGEAGSGTEHYVLTPALPC